MTFLQRMISFGQWQVSLEEHACVISSSSLVQYICRMLVHSLRRLVWTQSNKLTASAEYWKTRIKERKKNNYSKPVSRTYVRIRNTCVCYTPQWKVNSDRVYIIIIIIYFFSNRLPRYGQKKKTCVRERERGRETKIVESRPLFTGRMLNQSLPRIGEGNSL